MEIKVMTYNIHHGKGMDKKVDLYRIAEIIEKSDADIIGLNEVDKHYSKRSHHQDQVRWLANHLDMDYAFAPSVSLTVRNSVTVRQYGNALLSRFPILNTKTLPFDVASRLIEGRSILDVTLQLNEKLLQVNVTHFSLNPFLQRMQTNFLVNQVNNYVHPLIILGDFNMKPGSRGWKKLICEFSDGWYIAGNGKGSTYPSLRPRSRLDYIFSSPSIEVINTEIITKLPHASDHLPVKAHLRI
ncbi:endonuclease/exonuclease/phosphatase family protein [Virgibacillus sp. C22-A2]|uniref:Endonuclease/exonuclease/phosphatase family protein n=1 Tax=Virgibacillus tibetensis TaxID=3042313 RepID=A0ABU6KKY9_9BACI|nr:endonuclease/exonuclease/phosphatase family protein [Virgibacillus sp. C22-A2]